MAEPLPNLSFRIEPGYTFDHNLLLPGIDNNNVLAGGLPSGRDQNAIFLGRVAEYQRSKNVWLDYEGAHAIYVMGKRRSGKTYTLGVLLEGLASKKWIRQGRNQQAIVMLDTMNVFITMPHATEDVYGCKTKWVEELRKWNLEKEDFDIVLFYPRGTPRPPEGNSKEIAVKPSDLSAEDWASLFGFDTYSDPMGQLIADLYEKVAEVGFDHVSGQRIDAKREYSVDDLIECLDGCQAVINAYHLDTVRAIRARLKAIQRLPIFSNTGIDLRDVFNPGQISILLLRDLEQNLRSLLVGILVKKIMELRSISDKFERLASVHDMRRQKLLRVP